jgi:hypothetical protein
MLMGSTEHVVLLLNTSNSRIFMGRHHNVVNLLGIPEGEMCCVARRAGICAVRNYSWVVATRRLRSVSGRPVESTVDARIKGWCVGYRPIKGLELSLLRGIVYL